MYSSPARLRVEREAARRGNAPVVITTLLSLLVIAGAVAAVAYLVLRAPSSAVDSAERLDPVGTAIPAPTEQPVLPTPLPTTEPEPTALGFTGEEPAVSGLPTVAAELPQESGPTPTPRLIALPAEAPPTVLPTAPPAPTLPPAIAVEEIPVVALEPVESAPPPPPVSTTEPARSQPTREAASRPDERDDDPFNIFEPDDVPRIVPSQNDNLERARELQDGGNRGGRDDRGGSQDDFPEIVVPIPDIDIPEIVAADEEPVIQRRDGSVEVIMPDVDAMIDEITARATDPNRNPNVGDAGRSRANRDDNGDEPTPTTRRNRKKSRDNESRSPITNAADSPGMPVIEPSNPGRGGDDDCPFANLPEDQRPKDWPFGDC